MRDGKLDILQTGVAMPQGKFFLSLHLTVDQEKLGVQKKKKSSNEDCVLDTAYKMSPAIVSELPDAGSDAQL